MQIQSSKQSYPPRQNHLNPVAKADKTSEDMESARQDVYEHMVEADNHLVTGTLSWVGAAGTAFAAITKAQDGVGLATALLGTASLGFAALALRERSKSHEANAKVKEIVDRTGVFTYDEINQMYSDMTG